ncbi:helix-turn-helix domain-containing protein [Kutzneria buriramensis]|nr:helix-turn-helix domain-containing protein [Kutzneria buriramensis]
MGTDLSREAVRPDDARVLADSLDTSVLADRALTAASPAARRFADLEPLLRIVTAHLVAVAEGVPQPRPDLHRLGVSAAVTGVSIDALVGVLGDLTVRVMDEVTLVAAPALADLTGRLKQMMASGHRLTRSLLSGFLSGWLGDRPAAESWSDEQLVRKLLSGAEVPEDLPQRLADSYAVVAVRAKSSDTITQLRRMLATSAWSTYAALLQGVGGYLVGPAARVEVATDVARQLRGLTTDALWCGVAWGQRATLAATGEEAAEAVAIAIATASPPGTYRVADFLVEYAASRQDRLRDELIRIGRPVVANHVLRTTLKALLEADSNRSQAARLLVVHRSTLDYRLSRIEAMTGHSPTTPRGLQVLGAALTICTVDMERAALPSVANH